MRKFALLAVLFCCLPSAAIFAQQSSTPPRKALAPEALLNLRRLSSLEFSPDGTRVAFVVAEPAKGDQPPSHIWLFDTSNGSFRQLTYSVKSESSPKWSPDGKSLAFLSHRDANHQIYVLSMSGGESVPLTKGKRNISRFEWSLDGKTIAFLAPDAKTEAEEKKEKDKDDARVVDKDDKHARLWLLSLSDKSERAITPANYQLSDLAWFPDNRRLAVIATDHPESDRNTERIFLVQTTGQNPEESMVQVLAPRGPIGDIKISPSGDNISFIGSREEGPSPHHLWILPFGMPAAKNLTAGSLDRTVFAYRWTKDRGLILLAAEGFTRRLGRYTSRGTPADIAFVGETFTEPQEIWFAPEGQQPKNFPEFNKSFDASVLTKPELYKYKSFDGLEIEAALLKPSNHDGKSKLPLIALINCGPTGAWESSIEAWGQLLAARGYAVFYPNIRGSIGYGEKFVEGNRGDWGGGDFKDVMAGIDDLANKGIADLDRLGIGGWSYGGYMSEWAITQTPRFKAAVSGAGMANLISEYGTEQHPSYDEWFWGVPYEKPTGFLNSSPFLHVKNVKTPTLILRGDADTVDPRGKSQELYRGLKRYGAETESVVYPREPHGFHEEKHLVDRLNRILAWYDRYLKSPGPATATK